MLSISFVPKLSKLFRYGSSHKNVSIILCYQSFFNVPAICRKTSNVLISYKPLDRDEIQTIGRRMGLKKEEIGYIFDTICKDVYDTL